MNEVYVVKALDIMEADETVWTVKSEETAKKLVRHIANIFIAKDPLYENEIEMSLEHHKGLAFFSNRFAYHVTAEKHIVYEEETPNFNIATLYEKGTAVE